MKNNTKKNTKKIHKKKGGTASKKKSPGNTGKKTPKQAKNIRQYNNAQDRELKLHTINRHRTDDDNALPYADNSILRALTRYSGKYVENLSAAQIETIYQDWRDIESKARKGHRANKRNNVEGSTRGAQKKTVEHDDADLRNYAAAVVEEMEAADALIDMNKYGSNDFSVPGSPNPTVDAYPHGFTPYDRKRKSTKIDTKPQDLFKELNDEIDDDFFPELNLDENV